MYFSGYFSLSNGPIWEVICIIAPYQYFRWFLVKIWVFEPPGWPYIGIPPTVSQLILKKYHYALSWMYFCGYFSLSNGPIWEVICIIPIFQVIFGQNLCIWPPGVTIYRDTPTVSQLILKKYHHALSWMYFCGYFVLSNGPNWEVICLIPIFGVILVKILAFYPPGWAYIVLPPAAMQLILMKYYIYCTMLCPKCVL
jgi:hypothetical protein